MDSQKKDSSGVVLPVDQWLAQGTDGNRLIAWSRTREWYLTDLRRDVSILISRLQPMPAQRWALCFNDCYAFAVSLLAVLYCGKVPVLLGHMRQALLEEQQGEFDALLTDSELALTCPMLRFSSAITLNDATQNAPLPAFPANAELILFTSGSTGKPQKVVKPLSSLQIESQWLAQRWGNTLKKSRFVATVSSQHMYGLTFRFMLPLSLGVPFFSENLEVHEQLITMAQHLPLTLISSPTFLQRLDNFLPSVNCVQIFSAGGPLSVSETQRVHHLCGVYPIDIYGTTETGIMASRQQQQENTPWTLFDGVDFLPSNRVTSAIIPEPLGAPLGDKLQILAESREFHLLGRKDRIVNIAEQRLSLDEIEHRLCQLPNVKEAVALAIERKGRQYIAAVIVLRTPQDELSHTALTLALRQSLRPWLPPVALPRFWRFLPAMPLNQQGKRAYAELQELFA